jgi:phosphoribosyl-dephospho-CoA transferase
MTAEPRCHDLVWVHAARLPELVVGEGFRAEVARWMRRNLPAVVTRQQPLPGEGLVRLGIPLPPSRGRARIALLAPPGAVRRMAPPVPLRDVVASADPAWQAPLRELTEGAAALGVSLRVHGSLAWQHLTGEPYMTSASDLDLLVDVTSRRELERAFRLLESWERRSGRVADAEVRLPGGGVSWRELASDARQVLVRGSTGPALLPRAHALASLAAGAP